MPRLRLAEHPLALTLLVALAALAVAQLLTPAPAQAAVPIGAHPIGGSIPIVGPIVSGVTGLVGGVANDIFVKGFGALLDFIFGKTLTALAQSFLTDLLDVVALDRTGTLVRSDGTLVRYYELIPQNPEVLAEDQQEVIIDGLGRALGALRAGETLQIYAVAAPIQLPELLTQLKQRLTDCLDSQPADRASAYSELAAAYEQTLRRRTIDNAAVRLRIYLIVPFSPENVSARVDWKSQLPGARRIKARAGVSRALKAPMSSPSLRKGGARPSGRRQGCRCAVRCARPCRAIR